ncbi:MAG: PadR family transcriptional regulator [Deltaproteobacteria bacterium]|nr:PadR family transcriptional regulator [Deltaproteobacteria bacterium]
MPRRENKTIYALLGLLSRGPQSGYDIKKAFEGRLSSFWNESYGQIYIVLRRLVEEGLATKSVKRQEGKPDRHEYRITAKGRAKLRQWLAEPVPRQIGRHEMVLKVLFGTQLSVSECLHLVRGFRELHQGELLDLKMDRERLKEERKDDPGLPYYLMSIRYGELVNEAYVKWCDEIGRALKAMQTLSKGQTGGKKGKKP